MKKILFSSALLLAIMTAKAQGPTLDFQTWGSSFGEQKQPTGWLSENALTVPLISTSNPTSVFKDSLTNAHTGYSMKITTVKIQSNPIPGQIPSGLPDTVGIAMAGTVGVSGGSLSLKAGFAFVGRPQNVTFWYKSAPMAGDTCGASVTLWKTESGVRKTVATGNFRTGATVGTITQATITMVYDATEGWRWPDSASVIFGSSFRMNFKHPQIGSAMWVDDIVWGAGLVTGISENTASNTQVSVFPNPATTIVNFETANTSAEKIYVYDVTGKLVASELFENGKARLNTSSLNNGLYIYAIFNKDKQAIYTQKFNVNK